MAPLLGKAEAKNTAGDICIRGKFSWSLLLELKKTAEKNIEKTKNFDEALAALARIRKLMRHVPGKRTYRVLGGGINPLSSFGEPEASYVFRNNLEASTFYMALKKYHKQDEIKLQVFNTEKKTWIDIPPDSRVGS